MPMSILKKPEQPRSVNPNVDKEFLEPYKFVEIKNTKHLVIPKGIKSTATRKTYTAAVRQLVATGLLLRIASFMVTILRMKMFARNYLNFFVNMRNNF